MYNPTESNDQLQILHEFNQMNARWDDLLHFKELNYHQLGHLEIQMNDLLKEETTFLDTHQ